MDTVLFPKWHRPRGCEQVAVRGGVLRVAAGAAVKAQTKGTLRLMASHQDLTSTGKENMNYNTETTVLTVMTES